MKRLIIKRLLQLIPMLIGMSFVSFIIIQSSPGDYFAQMKMNPEISPETIESMRTSFGLDRPILVQYFLWLKNMCKLDFGVSFAYHIPVKTLIKFRLKNTICLAIFSLFMSWIIAVPLAVIAGYKEGTFFDKLLSMCAYFSISLPSFFVALLFVYFISKTNLLPIGGTRSIFEVDASTIMVFKDYMKHLLVPGLVLCLVNVGGLFRLMKNNFIETFNTPFILAAWARGVSRNSVIFKHTLRNALNPMFTILGMEIGSLLNGAALTEIICGWPGMGSLVLEAVLSHDLYLVMGSLVISGFLLVLGNLIGDILIAFFDPRIRIS
ncbi:MAG: ABC transporter permease [Candidatus Omnitrophica bacterium]|nr:ABC transporter permease [Candidatus Omnitrophota bacterium]MCM8824672.1 ABC transporter permease [Candidatus Omnitrophota bacterium]